MGQPKEPNAGHACSSGPMELDGHPQVTPPPATSGHRQQLHFLTEVPSLQTPRAQTAPVLWLSSPGAHNMDGVQRACRRAAAGPPSSVRCTHGCCSIRSGPLCTAVACSTRLATHMLMLPCIPLFLKRTTPHPPHTILLPTPDFTKHKSAPGRCWGATRSSRPPSAGKQGSGAARHMGMACWDSHTSAGGWGLCAGKICDAFAHESSWRAFSSFYGRQRPGMAMLPYVHWPASAAGCGRHRAPAGRQGGKQVGRQAQAGRQAGRQANSDTGMHAQAHVHRRAYMKACDGARTHTRACLLPPACQGLTSSASFMACRSCCRAYMTCERQRVDRVRIRAQAEPPDIHGPGACEIPEHSTSRTDIGPISSLAFFKDWEATAHTHAQHTTATQPTLTAATEPFHVPLYTTPKPPLPTISCRHSSSIHSSAWLLACVLRSSF